jgi:eukaryotic-like serine/threonine-protein kinase
MSDSTEPSAPASDGFHKPANETPTWVPTEEPAAPVEGTPPALPAGRSVPSAVEPQFELLERIGEGGMGDVYRGRQTAPLERPVAIKLLKAGLDSARFVRRFGVEQQLMARLDHPNIARVFHTGTSPQGRPFYAMEFVDGEPIGRFADRHRLTLAARAELMAQVCDAVDHANARAVVHRDLKPGNILVTMNGDVPTAKVIDFGLAKAMGGMIDEAMLTYAGQTVGTAEYMSPEQATGTRDIDQRCDVYGLGVVMYELACGMRPFDEALFREMGHQEKLAYVRERSPPRLSERVDQLGERQADVARSRRLRVDELIPAIRAGLDQVVARAMHRDREQRYARASDMARDLRLFAAGKPPIAIDVPGPRAGAFATGLPNRGTILAAIAIGLVLLLAMVFILRQQAQIRSMQKQLDSMPK